MNKLMKFQHLISVTLTVCFLSLFLSCGKDSTAEEVVKEPEKPKEEEGINPVTPTPIDVTELIKTKSNQVKSVISTQTQTLEEGISVTTLKYINTADKNMSISVLVADFSYKHINAQALNPYNSDEKRFQVLPDIAKANEEPGTKIWAAVNGDYFSWSNMETTGPFIYDGKVRKPNPSGSTRPAFGITRTGLPVFLNAPTGQSNIYNYGDNLLRHLVGGNQWFIYNGKLMTINDTTVEPRSSIGMRDDKKVIAIVVDGRNPTHSNGMSFVQLQSVYNALGAKFAFNLDGGHSSIMVARQPSSAVWNTVNVPSESNPYRAIANGIGFISTK